jgi:hypothetical protein
MVKALGRSSRLEQGGFRAKNNPEVAQEKNDEHR